MTLPAALQDREVQKFTELNGEVAVRTTATGNFVFSGLSIGGRITEVTIDDVSWTPLPPTPLANRNAMSIQNVSGFEIKVNYVDSVGYIGMVIPNNNERYYDIKDSIIMYARAQSGSGSVIINVEELA